MTVLHSLPCQPDRETIASFIEALFRASGLRGQIEVAWTAPAYPHKVTGARLFDLADIDEMVDHVVRINATPNRNAYVAAGLRSADAPIDRRARDDQVISCVALWADCDKEGALSAALDVAERAGLTPSIVTFTGRAPHLRGQLWWVLDEPCEDLARVRRLNEALAARLGTDPAVVNIGRVMRVAGSVAWPLKEGRTLEMTGLHDAPTRAAPYTIDEVESLLRRAGALEKPAPTAKILDFSTAEPTLDLDDLVDRAHEPGQWHRHALLAVAHLIGRGTPADVVFDVLAPRLTTHGYTVAQTYADLRPMIEGALRKGFAPEARSEEGVGSTAVEPKVSASPFWTIEQLLDLPPPEWLVDGYLVEQGVSVLFGPPGSFKSFIALDMALSVAHGVDWRGRSVKAVPTVYICAEGQYGFGARGLVWRTHRANGAECVGFWVLPVPVNFLEVANVAQLVEAINTHAPGARFIIVDTLIRNFGHGDENSTKDMAAFIGGIDKLAADLKAHVMIVHHSGLAGGDRERGSSALRGAVNAAIQIDRDQMSERVTIKVKKQKDGPEADPLRLTVPIAEAVHPVTGEVVTSRLPTIDEARVAAAAAPVRQDGRLGKYERDVLAILADGPQTHATILARLGGGPTVKRGLNRALQALEEMNFIDQDGALYLLKEGHENDEE